MALWINILFAWIALVLSFLLIVIWALRLIYKKKKIQWIRKANRALRHHHKLVGLLLIATALIHGLFSSDEVFSLNWGTANWIVSILLGLSWMLRKRLNLKKWWMHIHRALTAVFVGLLVIHILNVGGFILDDMIAGRIAQPLLVAERTQQAEQTPEIIAPVPSPTAEPTLSPYDVLPTLSPEGDQTAAPSAEPTATPQQAATPLSAKYIDGVYQGTGDGYRPGLVVEVVIENDTIVSVTVIDHNEVNERFWGYPIEAVPQWIVEAQSTDVDIVSGATYTSLGIQEAVSDALSKALAD